VTSEKRSKKEAGDGKTEKEDGVRLRGNRERKMSDNW